MLAFMEERLKTGHTSPLEQVSFEFGISGVSRAFSHQFVRHRIGISFEQQSQRYVTYKNGTFPFTVPRTVERAGFADDMRALFDQAGGLYERLIEAGVPAEDARFLLPNATNTNFKITVNFLELLHICDQRLCTRAQWEFRRVAALMRAEVVRAVPPLGRMLQPKCGELRQGYCDETTTPGRPAPSAASVPTSRTSSPSTTPTARANSHPSTKTTSPSSSSPSKAPPPSPRLPQRPPPFALSLS